VPELHRGRRRLHALGGIAGQFLAAVLCENFGIVGSYCFLVPVVVLMVLATTSTSIREGVEARRERRAPEAETGSPAWFDTRQRNCPAGDRPACHGRSCRKPNVRQAAGAGRSARRPSWSPSRPRRAADKPKKASQGSIPLRRPRSTCRRSTSSIHRLHSGERIDEQSLIASSRILESKLADFGVQGKVTAVRPGPVIKHVSNSSRLRGVKVNRIVTPGRRFVDGGCGR